MVIPQDNVNTLWFDEEEIRGLVIAACIRHDCIADVAETIAETMIATERSGVWTHGLRLLPVYLDNIARERINSRPQLTVASRSGGTAVLDGDNGPGMFVASRAMELCVELASAHGIGSVSVRNSSHFGAAGHYCRLGAANGMLTMVTTSGSPAMAPWGGSKAFFPATPLAFGIPRIDQQPLVVDFALTSAARAKIRVHHEKRQSIPLGWALDHSGQPTTDAGEALSGALLPIGDHKGYALAFVLEVLSSVLSGSPASPELESLYSEGYQNKAKVSHFFWGLRVEHFLSSQDFARNLGELVERLHDEQPREEGNRVRVPGEGQNAYLEGGYGSSLALQVDTSEALTTLFAKLNLPIPTVLDGRLNN